MAKWDHPVRVETPHVKHESHTPICKTSYPHYNACFRNLETSHIELNMESRLQFQHGEVTSTVVWAA